MASKTATFPVKGMSCKHCARSVHDILTEDVPGVEAAEVSLEFGRVKLSYDPDTDLNLASKLLKDGGYDLVLDESH